MTVRDFLIITLIFGVTTAVALWRLSNATPEIAEKFVASLREAGL